ncbi:hypothetical protein Acr_24g0006560 [Actinidia rufa]|uniref:Uncharacterized protein n=1 Tax=Actinidia rufa TaxID=165716 RepID=A0A7J0GUK3_9ERIC|nr:hypothetical protein Acr_24g0006560 [Actinidia rufa]
MSSSCSSHSHIVTECPKAHEFPEFIRKYINVTQGSQGYVYNEPCLICASHSYLVTECPQAHEFPELFQNDVNATQGSQEFVYNEPCPICSSYCHIFTECPKPHEFSEFVQKYNNTTQGCWNPRSNNSYSYTHNHEWETHSNPSWIQEPWVEHTKMSCLSSHYIAPPEQPPPSHAPPVASVVSMPYSAPSTPQQTQYQPPHWRNEDNELRTKVTNIEQQLEKMNFLLENFVMAQQTQGQFPTQTQPNSVSANCIEKIHEQVTITPKKVNLGDDKSRELDIEIERKKREVEIVYKEDNGEVCDAHSEPCSFAVEIISEDHEIFVQDLVTPPKEFTQWEDKVELFDCPTKSSIDVELINFLGVDKFNGVVDPYLIQFIFHSMSSERVEATGDFA